MSKEIYISSTPHETRLAIVESDALSEVYYERENEYTLAGSIYNGRVTRVLPGMQSAFVDIGLERDAFLYITDFMEEAGDSADFEGEGSHKNGGRREGASGSGEGRGRRDRRDRNGSRERQQNAEGGAASEREEYVRQDGPSEGAEEQDSEQARGEGEGVSSAEGSRRWRGRRRRGRGRGRQQSAEGEQTVEPQQEGEEYGAPIEIDGSTEAVEAVLESAPETEQPSDEGFHRSEDRGRGRRDRGGRDRGRRAPRGFAPRTSLYGLEGSGEEYSTEKDQPEPGHEAIVLPGESLSKYRKPGEEEPVASAAKPAPVVAAPTAPGYEIPAGWDGGLVLPGESLSRRRRKDPPVAAPVPEVVEETTTEELASAPLEEKPAEPVEYEPTEETSVSYRFDPVPPSEFRQSAPVEEPVESPVEEVAAHHSELPHVEIEQHEFVETHATAPEEPEVAAEVHEVTSIEASGEMVSPEPEVSTVETEAEQQAFEHAADRIEEGAIHGAALDPDTLFASSIEELDDFDEEETLEGAADLGTMIREMSIDEVTAPALEEEDFEEEEAVDDGSYETAGAEYAVEDETEEDEGLTDEEDSEESETGAVADGAATEQEPAREFDRRRGRRDRRGGRGVRHTGGGDRRRGRSSVQATDLPAITELLKPGQEVLVQIAKEPIAKKGARITSHIALPGRFLVFMPTVNHTGVSRKIESDGERRRLKEILLSEKGDAAGGFIVRTAAAGATEEELRSDLRFLLNLWADIKQRSESSKSPALIYHDLNLVERILRDQVTDNFSAIWVDSEDNYERILRFLQRFQPSLIRRVKLYTKETPLFEQFGITEEINKALRSKVWLKSGGSIVINQTEALVAIDINTGKYVGKTARLEDTIVKTNLDAIPEIVRQIRLRDLGGIIIIDFIDMDERKNRQKVMAALEEELKNDRAPSKILQFNDFGLVAITRKRVKQSLERTLSTQCNICAGTGMVKSPVTVCNDIYVEMRKMSKHLDRNDVMLRVHPDVVKQLKSSTKWLQEMEEMVGKTILVKSDPSLHPEQFDIH
ncbi:Rne/Rng family ribonuclease [Edaphobacter albus]|uniref:Rne/Rng family ribonuclease n=1 Tax=Edaphobacter sp. 4G125 TaxID=2763071 RepID=UPI00164612AF|nr:Rne/Rng family ribonuclease [Edaphobacter sp. 4G125]QNI36498.1 Rne/Rng family ribonuclease [Edaphobacter sp. 4G125]